MFSPKEAKAETKVKKLKTTHEHEAPMTQGSFILTMAVQSPVVHLLTNRLGLSSFTIPRLK